MLDIHWSIVLLGLLLLSAAFWLIGFLAKKRMVKIASKIIGGLILLLVVEITYDAWRTPYATFEVRVKVGTFGDYQEAE